MGCQKVYARIKLFAILSFLVLLFGCSGKPLSDRAIVRGIFFLQTGGRYQTVILLQNQRENASAPYLTAVGEGKTAAQALSDATSGLDGQVFYGAMDTVAFPSDSDWQDIQVLTRLINETAQPSPEVSLYLLEQQDTELLPDRAGKVYEELLQCGKQYGLQCGLETVAAQENVTVLPIWQQKKGYGIAIFTRGEDTIYYHESTAAQLAAVICRQSGRLDILIEEKTISCRAETSTIIRAAPNEIQIILRLTDSKLSSLTQPVSEEKLQEKLTKDLQSAFSHMMDDVNAIQTDPFRLAFWEKCMLGRTARLPVRLIVEYL